MKKKILFCSEATFLNTGYATYTREILNYLHSTNKYEIAELGSYAHSQDNRAKNIPWKFYGVMPSPHAPKNEHDRYNSAPTFQFGEYAFDNVCLDYRPDIVCDIRDFWMLEHQERSPFRRFFKWCIMPTVDAAPQARQWIATYQSSDACLSYSDWAGEVIKDQSGGKINYIGSSPPSAHAAYRILPDKAQLKKSYGVPEDIKVIGTVMRNQRRKLYPDLFITFRKFLDTVENPQNYILYCHTSYPDMGWDIPELLNQYNLASHVMFTYVCPVTNKTFASKFKGAVIQSPFTGQFNCMMSNVKTGASYEQLSEIMNMFDLYVQYANSEGFGLPQVEAAACGVPVMSTDYSAMESVIRQLGGTPLTPKALYKELETGCFRAVPDNDFTNQKLIEFFKKSEDERKQMGEQTRQNFEKHFRWDQSGSQWEKYFDSVEPLPEAATWMSSPEIQRPDDKNSIDHTKMSPSHIARWLVTNVLKDPSKVNSFMEARLIRDLMYQNTTSTTGGMYFNESSAAFEGKNTRTPFDFNTAYDHFAGLRNRQNQWEKKRAEVMRL